MRTNDDGQLQIYKSHPETDHCEDKFCASSYYICTEAIFREICNISCFKTSKLKFTKGQRIYSLRTRSPDNEIVSEETKLRRALLRSQRVKRSKFAILLAYTGQGYFGFQRNLGVKTIEGDLMAGLLEAGYINEQIFNESKLIRFIPASRTDKGVSSVGQVISLNLPRDADKGHINQHLPPEIRVLALLRVTRGFNSRTYGGVRTYSFTLPSLSFQRHANDTFRLSHDLRRHIDAILQLFVGNHRFHNFTAKKSFWDTTAFRTIVSFICGKQFIVDGMEFIVLNIKGQSFMLHQIRKMVGLTIAVVRGLTSQDTVYQAFRPIAINVPLPPGVGLVLEEVNYEHYNKKYGNDGTHTEIEWNNWNEEKESFKQKMILPRIIQAEKNHFSYPLLL